MRVLVVANPVAGRGLGERVGRAVAEGLRRRGVAAELHLTGTRADRRTRLAAECAGADVVVAVGGDGTLREVLEGLPDPDVPVGVVPAGTANVLARDLALPRGVDRAVDTILRGKCIRLDVARVGGRLCFLAASVGFDAMAVRELERRRRGPVSWWTWAGALARTFARYRPPRLTVEIDGTALPGQWGLVIVSNCVRYAGLLRLAADRRLDDGLFEAHLLRDASRFGLAAAVACGVVAGLPDGVCELRRARRVRITSEEPVPYQVDGDRGGETPMELEVLGRQHRLLVP